MKKNDTDKREFLIYAIFFVLLVAGLTFDGCTGQRAFGVEFRRAQPTLGDVHAASCRVRVSNARGTGIFNGYNAAENVAYISTNDHVTTTAGSCKLDFWTNYKMQTVDGRVVYSLRDDRASRDFAIIAVDATELKKIDPPYIPMKALRLEDLPGRAFLSSGCPDGRFDQGFRGTIERVDGGMAVFSPPPVPGQSGSGICILDNGKIYDVAKLTYLLGKAGMDESKGGALPLSNLINNAPASFGGVSAWFRTPVADFNCGDDQTPVYSIGADNGVKMAIPGETEKTIAVYVTDPESYEMTPAPVARRSAPRGLFDDLLRDDGDRDGRAQEQEQPPQEDEPATPRLNPRRNNPDADQGGLIGGGALVDRIGERVGESVSNAVVGTFKKFSRIIFWTLVVCAAFGTILARCFVATFKWAARNFRAFTGAFTAALKENNENNTGNAK